MDARPAVEPHARTIWRRYARSGYESAVSAAARLDLRLAFRCAAAFGRVAHTALSLEPSIEDVADAYGLDKAEATRIARESSARHQQTRLLMTLLRRHGIASLARSFDFDPSSLAALARASADAPLIFLTCHAGPVFALGCAFSRLGIRPLAIRRTNGWYPATPGIDLAPSDGPGESRAAAFASGLSRLRDGGLVLMAADARGFSTTHAVPFFGRGVAPARGPFALARMTGAPIVPIVARDTSQGSVTLLLGEPLQVQGRGTGAESALAAAAMAWFESYISRHPEELWVGSLRWLRSAPWLGQEAPISGPHQTP